MNIIIDRTWKQGSLVNIEDLRGLTFQAEAQAHTFRISGVDAAGNPITLTGTPSGVMLRPDNTDVALTCAVSDGKVTATLPAECYDVPGRVGITIYLTSSNSQKVCIYSAITSVNRTSSGTASPGTTSSVVDLVNAINAAINSIPASYSNLLADIAPTYSDSALYAVGQYAWHDGDLKRCIVPITTSESYTAAHWTSAVLGQDVCDLKSALNDIDIRDAVGVTKTVATLYNGSVGNPGNTKLINTGSIRNKSTLTPVKSGKTVTIKINRAIETGYHYTVGYSPFDSSYVKGTDVSDVEIANDTFTIKVIPSGVAFYGFQIGRKDAYGNAVDTNISDFSGSNIVITVTDEHYQRARDFFDNHAIEFIDGKYFNINGSISNNSDYKYAQIKVDLFAGNRVYGKTALEPNSSFAIGFKDINGVLLSSYTNTTAGTFEYNYDVEIPQKACWFYLSVRKANDNLYVAPEFDYDVFEKLQDNKKNIESVMQINTKDGIIPILRNGSIWSTGNTDAVTTDYVIPIDKTRDYLCVEFIGDTTLADEYIFSACLFNGATDGMSTSTALTDGTISHKDLNKDSYETEHIAHKWYKMSDFNEYDHISFGIYRKKNNTIVPIRTATEQSCLRVTSDIYPYQITEPEYTHELKCARHITSDVVAPLTILHFSDIHDDQKALERIMAQANKMDAIIDDAICTGDIVANTGGSISAWWNPSVMTCIGNHDTATYSSETGYDWTALSMADRDAYYIAPFESGWGIVHTPGTSYYYKDYTDQKVRLIVLDAMLYMGTPGEEATTQTVWLAGLLSDAITNDLHVLIAIHAVHGGANAIECTFSRYGQAEMPTYSDCNTPQTIIDTVATAITNGLHFIGYIVGHTHQDNIWDAENNRTQLMYCVTCANVALQAQWINSDLYRGDDADAYNLITINTSNTYIKLVRGGGADISDKMVTRKGICFNYSTGQIIGQIS